MATFDGSSLLSLKPLTANQERGKRAVNAPSGEAAIQSDRQKLSQDALRHPRQAENIVLDIKFTFETTMKEGILLLALGVSLGVVI